MTKSLKEYELNKYNEIIYIKKFVTGVTKGELREMFRKHMRDGFLTILMGVKLLDSKQNRKMTT